MRVDEEGPLGHGDPDGLRGIRESGLTRVRELARRGMNGIELSRLHSSSIDLLIKEAFNSLIPGGRGTSLTVMAAGGYGRGEICLHSDVDILFLFGSPSPRDEEEVVKLLHLLYLLKVPVSHRVGTGEEYLKLIEKDFSTATALLDTRFICGHEGGGDTFQSLLRDFYKGFFHDYMVRSGAFKELDRRSFGDSVYLMEPNVKESPGGLRDFHRTLWLGKILHLFKDHRDFLIQGYLRPEEYFEFFSAYDFILRVRFALHILSDRKVDRLTLEMQEDVGHFLGFKDSRGSAAAQKLMRRYYLSANSIAYHSDALTRRLTAREGDRLAGGFEEEVLKESGWMMRFFKERGWEGQEGSFREEVIRRNLKLVNRNFRQRKENQDLFRSITADYMNAGDALMEMHRSGVLVRFIPEFRGILFRPQYNRYHRYTVDIHSLKTVQNIGDLFRGGDDGEGEVKGFLERLKGVAVGVKRKDLLILSALFHDIGKGKGRGHARYGAEMARGILARLGYSPEDTNLVCHIVAHHLDMIHVSLRRNLNDPLVIENFLKGIEGREALDILFILTWADLKALGEPSISGWRLTLIEDLYLRARDAPGGVGKEPLAGGREAPGSREVEAVMKEVEEILLREVPEGEVEGLLNLVLPAMFDPLSGYHSIFMAPDIATHAYLIREAVKGGVATHLKHLHDRGFSQWTACLRGRRGLLAEIAGLLSYCGINILGADFPARKDDIFLATFYLSSLKGRVLEEEERWRKVSRLLGKVASGNFSPSGRPPAAGVRRGVRGRRAGEPVVEFDSQGSHELIVVDIVSADKIGLLHSILKTFEEMGFTVYLARVSTKGDMAADTFYIKKDGGGGEDGALALLRERLKRAMKGDS